MAASASPARIKSQAAARWEPRPTRAVAAWLRVLLLVHVMLAGVLVGLALVGAEPAGAEPVSREGLLTYGRFSFLQSLLLIATGIVWILWQHRVHSNMLGA